MMKIYKRISVVLLSLVMIAVLSACRQSSGNSSSSSISIANPIEGLTMGMSREDFARTIGTTAEELLAKNKASIQLSYTDLKMQKPELYGFELAKQDGGTGDYYDLHIYFAEDGSLNRIQAVILAKDTASLEKALTKLFGEPQAAGNSPCGKVWVGAAAESGQHSINYVDIGAGIGENQVYHLYVNA